MDPTTASALCKVSQFHTLESLDALHEAIKPLLIAPETPLGFLYREDVKEYFKFSSHLSMFAGLDIIYKFGVSHNQMIDMIKALARPPWNFGHDELEFNNFRALSDAIMWTDSGVLRELAKPPYSATRGDALQTKQWRFKTAKALGKPPFSFTLRDVYRSESVETDLASCPGIRIETLKALSKPPYGVTSFADFYGKWSTLKD